VGKKTLFTLLTGQAPTGSGSRGGSIGLAPVLDARFDRLVELFKPAKETPAVIDFSLLPDLDLDAERNAEALKALEDVDVICHLVRAFRDDSVYHVAGSTGPERDIRAFAEELQLNDLLFIEKRLERIERENKGKKDPRLQREPELLQRMRDHLEGSRPLSGFDLSEEESRLLASYPLLTRKAVINAVNVDEEQLTDPSLLAGLRQTFDGQLFEWISVSARIEEELGQLEPDERQEFLQELGIAQPALERLTRLCYRTLGLISFFTVGEDEVRAWTIRRGSLAPQAGRAIHTDIEKGFIRAEVMACDDLLELGSEARVKDAGKLLPKGRDYQVQDGDVLHFLFKL
jgi:ribosome-binding ATPase